jgi:hypothetical protein
VVVVLCATGPLAACGDDAGEPGVSVSAPRPCDTRPAADDAYAGFPVDDVPVIDGEVGSTWNGRDNGEWGCTVEIERADRARPAVDAALALLTEAGFTLVDEDLDDPGSPYARLTSKDYRVQVSGLDTYDGPGSTVSYDLRAAYVEGAYDDPDADQADATLPEGYPTDDVPLVEGRIASAEPGGDYQGWAGYDVTVVVETTASRAAADAVAALESAGLETVEPVSGDIGSFTARLADERYVVRLLASEDKEEEQVRVEYDVVLVPQESLPLPTDWPDVPVVDGLVTAVQSDGDTDQVSVLTDPPVAGDMTSLVDLVRDGLDAAGLRFDKRYGVYDSDGLYLFQYDGPGFRVSLSVGEESTTGRAVVSYTVEPA